MNCRTLFTLSFILLVASPSHGALSFRLQFANPFGVGADAGVLGGIADEVNSTASGLTWGILVANEGNSFPILTDLGLSADDGAQLAPGFRYFNGGTTTSIAFGTDPDVGVVGTSGTIELTAFEGEGYATGDAFALVWFERNFGAGDEVDLGTRYGVLTNAGFVVPGNTATEPLNVLFAGNPDPVKAANLTVVPEPSTALLGLLGLLGICRRKR